jgi:hypothetical protein
VQIRVSLQLPFIGGIEGTWEPENAERDAAWELYVELVTRVSVVELRPDQGTLREALTSYYQLFGITRGILRRYGPAVARGNGSRITFGRIAVAMLNSVIRPVLAHWHPLLLSVEQSLPDGVDMITHEQLWEEADRLRALVDGQPVSLLTAKPVVGGTLYATAPHFRYLDLDVLPDFINQRWADQLHTAMDVTPSPALVTSYETLTDAEAGTPYAVFTVHMQDRKALAQAVAESMRKTFNAQKRENDYTASVLQQGVKEPLTLFVMRVTYTDGTTDTYLVSGDGNSRLVSMWLARTGGDIEAAISAGTTPWQLLSKVQLPLARPTIMLGVNQTIMMVLAGVIIAGLVGSGGLGIEVVFGLTKSEIGRGLEAGLSIVFIGILLDRVTQAYGKRADVPLARGG